MLSFQPLQTSFEISDTIEFLHTKRVDFVLHQQKMMCAICCVVSVSQFLLSVVVSVRVCFFHRWLLINAMTIEMDSLRIELTIGLRKENELNSFL